MSTEQTLLIRASPHLHERESIPRIMWTVVVALTPAAAMGIYFFGLPAVRVLALSILSAEVAEVACLAMRRRPLAHALDGSAFITGMLLAMVLPPSVRWYCPVVGSAFAICIAKHCFGGLGCNIWNPALAGRVFLQFAYPTQVSLSKWPVPKALFASAGSAADAITAATPLCKEATALPGYHEFIMGRAGDVTGTSYLDLLLGNGIAGSLGETCKLALLAGAVLLLVKRYIDWRVPFFYIATVFLLVCVLPAPSNAPYWVHDPLYHILSGGLILGAFFMATDMVTTPVTRGGRIVFAIGCGILVAVIRFYGGYPEGVAFSIVLMNTATPLIDRWCRPRIFGSRTPRATMKQP